jgi:hypothetical protein
LYSQLAEQDAIVADAHGVDMAQVAVAATAVSRQRTELVEVSSAATSSVRHWDSQMLEDRAKSVTSVAHDRHLTRLGATGRRYQMTASVATAEPGLDF